MEKTKAKVSRKRIRMGKGRRKRKVGRKRERKGVPTEAENKLTENFKNEEHVLYVFILIYIVKLFENNT